jgi:hypothetical protein
MGYTEAPVYNDPPSNGWFGMQVWGTERVAQLYYASGNLKAKALLDKWLPWAMSNSKFTTGSTWAIPSDLAWSGKPDTWSAANPGANAGLHVTVTSKGQDVGVAGGFARTLMYYAAKSSDATAKANAKTLLDAIWGNEQDSLGVSTPETRTDYARFDDVLTSTTGNGVYIPSGWSGTMPNGDVIKPGVSFLDIRSWYKNDQRSPRSRRTSTGERRRRSPTTASGRGPPSPRRTRPTTGCSARPRRRRRPRRRLSPRPSTRSPRRCRSAWRRPSRRRRPPRWPGRRRPTTWV